MIHCAMNKDEYKNYNKTVKQSKLWKYPRNQCDEWRKVRWERFVKQVSF